MELNNLKKDLEIEKFSEKSYDYKKFFNREYTDEKEVFLGIPLPIQRKIAKNYLHINLANIEKLLDSNIHEYKMVAGIILTNKFKKNPSEDLIQFYLKHLKKFNNWDLIDTTAPKIIGNFLVKNNKKRKILYELSNSKNLWEKRAAIVSTLSLIKNNEFKEILTLSETLLQDNHHLIQKAIGWMLREVGKKDEKTLLFFLDMNYKLLSRITLRYAIEKFPKEKRKYFLNGVFFEK